MFCMRRRRRHHRLRLVWCRRRRRVRVGYTIFISSFVLWLNFLFTSFFLSPFPKQAVVLANCSARSVGRVGIWFAYKLIVTAQRDTPRRALCSQLAEHDRHTNRRRICDYVMAWGDPHSHTFIHSHTHDFDIFEFTSVRLTIIYPISSCIVIAEHGTCLSLFLHHHLLAPVPANMCEFPDPSMYAAH